MNGSSTFPSGAPIRKRLALTLRHAHLIHGLLTSAVMWNQSTVAAALRWRLRASSMTMASKNMVKALPLRAQGTVTVLMPCSGQSVRGTGAVT